MDSSNYFKEVVENIFNRWTSLKLAVEHGMGGYDGHQRAIAFMNETATYCLNNASKLDRDDLSDLLETVMDEDFDTICDDNSTKDVAFHLARYCKMCLENQFQEIANELAQLPRLESRWLTPGHRIVYAPETTEMDDSDDDSDAEDAVATEGGFSVTHLARDNLPSTSGSTMEVMEEEEVDPGWTVVKTKSKRK